MKTNGQRMGPADDTSRARRPVAVERIVANVFQAWPNGSVPICMEASYCKGYFGLLKLMHLVIYHKEIALSENKNSMRFRFHVCQQFKEKSYLTPDEWEKPSGHVDLLFLARGCSIYGINRVPYEAPICTDVLGACGIVPVHILHKMFRIFHFANACDVD